MLKKAALIGIVAVIAVALVWTLCPRDSKLRPVSEVEGKKLLAEIRSERKKLDASIKNGSGRVTSQMEFTMPGEFVHKYEIVGDVVFAGDSYEITIADYSSSTKEPDKPLTERLQQFGKKIVNPGSVKPSTGPGPIHFSDARLVRNSVYNGNSKSVTEYTPKKKEARVLDAGSMEGWMIYMTLRPLMVNTDSIYTAFKAGTEKWGPSYRNIRTTVVASEPVVLGRQRLGYDDCIVIEQQFSYQIPHRIPSDDTTQRVKFWVCPKKSCCILKVEVRVRHPKQAGDRLLSVTNSEVREYKPGVWSLVRSSIVGYTVGDDGEVRRVQQHSVARDPNFQLNAPKNKLDLKLKLPKGTKVVDEVKHKTYVVK